MDTIMNEQELFELKERIDVAKSKISELKGHQQYVMKELKEQWNCNSVEEAEEKAQTMKNEIEQFNERINKGSEELEEKYNV